ncbi:MAG: tryptophan--tRNA ligase [Tissierellales bacterium]|jgi:tryptophanyl-tRNA synthetase|nr:tryptophan--tRNA ligase [Tissierellales bacterium]
MEKSRIVSGIKPSGELTLGNYVGAIRNWVDFQDTYDCFYFIADLHAITVQQIPKDLRRNTLEILALYMACGLDPEKVTIFIQSHISAHAEVAWILDTMAQMGELNRMTQFKDKAKKGEAGLNAGLYTYPVLMAGDILLYQADEVPVGEDQKQHVELTRTLAQRFNHRYSDTFKMPEPFIPKQGARIMSLQDPTKKMSKSSDNENGYILLKDDAATIRRKVKRAVTDSVGIVAYNDDQLAIKNLLTIFSVMTGEKIEDIVKRYEGKGYGDFKADLAEAIVAHLHPIQTKFKELMDDKAYLEEVYADGAAKASKIAYKTLSKVYKKVGLVPRKF